MRALQMSSLRLIKRKLGPIVFHTSIPRYNQLLTEISVEARLLGLFGNITVPENCLPAKRTTGENKITGLYFGSAPAAQYHPLFAQKLKEFCEKNLLPLELIICGKSGVNGENFADEIAAACKGLHFEIVFLGELSPEALSDLFLKADFGIARIPPLFLGKSGSAISMLEHGLPLWVPLMGKDSISENLDFRPELCFHNLEDIKLMERRECISRLPHIADKFIQALN